MLPISSPLARADGVTGGTGASSAQARNRPRKSGVEGTAITTEAVTQCPEKHRKEVTCRGPEPNSAPGAQQYTRYSSTNKVKAGHRPSPLGQGGKNTGPRKEEARLLGPRLSNLRGGGASTNHVAMQGVLLPSHVRAPSSKILANPLITGPQINYGTRFQID